VSVETRSMAIFREAYHACYYCFSAYSVFD
jgi:hypothetical protein